MRMFDIFRKKNAEKTVCVRSRGAYAFIHVTGSFFNFILSKIIYFELRSFVRLIFILLLSVHDENLTILQIPDDDSVQVNAYRY